MTQDYNKKSVRQFQCRDYLWEIFEQMGSELECSVDYLLNEAMRQYARSRSQGRASAASAPSASAPSASAPRAPAASSPGRPTAAAPPNRPMARSTGNVPKPPPPSGTGPVGSMAPPPLPSAAPQAGNSGALPPLQVIFNGQKIPVAKEEFVIGRGSKTADLPIKDGNISRRHAAVVWQDGAFFMKDLGSTNGVEFHGERVSAKRIEEGDVFQLCDYELRFTYQ